MTAAQDEMVELLSPYLDGELSAEERRRVEVHLATCPSCRAELEELRESSRLLSGLRTESAPVRLKEGLRRRLRKQAARFLVTAFLVGLLVAVAIASIPLIAASLQPDLPLWFRVARAAAVVLLGVPLLLWVHELLQDVSSLVVYGWLSAESREEDQ